MPGLTFLPHSLARRSKGPKMASLYFWRPFQDSCRVAVVEPAMSYLESPRSPRRRWLPARKASQFGTAGCACLACRTRFLSLFSITVYLLHSLRRTAAVMARKKATADELDARAEANGYQRGAHREEDSRRDCNKHEDKIKKNQDATLGHLVI